jgi:predicted  nucleic acid-binding Zn-ribbon protein
VVKDCDQCHEDPISKEIQEISTLRDQLDEARGEVERLKKNITVTERISNLHASERDYAVDTIKRLKADFDAKKANHLDTLNKLLDEIERLKKIINRGIGSLYHGGSVPADGPHERKVNE